MNELLFEVSEYAPKKLKEMSKTISELEKTTSDSKIRAKLIQQIKDFTKINEIALFITDDFNAGVITTYKKNKIKDIISSFFNKYKDKRVNLVKPNELKTLTSVTESADMVQKIYIFIGKPLLKQMTADEMVAILLHEFGHIFSATSEIPDIILHLFEKINQFGIIIKYTLHIAGIIKSTVESACLFIFMLGLTHGIKFTQRLDEYKADNYTLKYGYGDELISAINKFNFKEKTPKDLKSMIKSFVNQFVSIFKLIFMPSDHPTEDNRIKNLEKQLFNKYKQLYPNYKEIIDVVHADYKKQVEV